MDSSDEDLRELGDDHVAEQSENVIIEACASRQVHGAPSVRPRAHRPLTPDNVRGYAHGVSFRVADPNELAQRALLSRATTKFLLERRAVSSFLAALSMDYDVALRDGEPMPHYQTLYFDTPDMRCYRDHVMKKKPRQKIRIRTYGQATQGFLEVKTQLPNHSIKQRQPTPHAYDMTQATALKSDDQRYLSGRAMLLAAALQPSLATHFRRITLIARDACERVTIDTDLVLSKAHCMTRLDALTVVEVKTQPGLAAASLAARLLFQKGVRATSFSKYCTGLRMLNSSSLCAERMRRVGRAA